MKSAPHGVIRAARWRIDDLRARVRRDLPRDGARRGGLRRGARPVRPHPSLGSGPFGGSRSRPARRAPPRGSRRLPVRSLKGPARSIFRSLMGPPLSQHEGATGEGAMRHFSQPHGAPPDPVFARSWGHPGWVSIGPRRSAPYAPRAIATATSATSTGAVPRVSARTPSPRTNRTRRSTGPVSSVNAAGTMVPLWETSAER
jgi:hypothetical protein